MSGDLRLGGTIEMTLTSTWTGSARIDVCEAPRHLLITTLGEGGDDAQLEAWLTAEGDRTRLVVEERGLPLEGIHAYGAGWQAHLEDLGRSLEFGGSAHPEGWSATEPSPHWRRRWAELVPSYENVDVS